MEVETAEDMFIQAEAALMELDAMARGEILGDPTSLHNAFKRLSQAYGVAAYPGEIYPGLPVQPQVPEISHVQPA